MIIIRVAAILMMASAPLSAAAQAVPHTITPPKGLNLGSTSFFDGFGRQTEGWTLLEYGRYETLDTINGPQGAPNPLFKGTDLQIFVALTQLSYTANWHPFGDNVAFSVAMPVIDYMKTGFAADSTVKLNNNGTNIGDIVWGPIYQSKIYQRDGHPSFAWRFQFLVLSPAGAMNTQRSINQGNGFWAINPYVAATFLPTAKIELSTRLNYQYNFPGTTFSSPPPIPGWIYRNGQGGQLIYDNFTASYAILPNLNAGLNGYVLDQLTPDRTNGQAVAKSRETELFMGPGLHAKLDPSDFVNLNTYFKAIANNASDGTVFNIQYIHRF